VSLAETTIRVWSPPTSRRKFRTKHAAYIGWAKDLIRKVGETCACDAGNWNEGPGPYTCPWHERLFMAPAFACTGCGAPDEKRGHCGCQPGSMHSIPTTMHSTARYMKLRNRLARWLRWKTERRA
jgi:hypothetical protein